VKLDVGSIPGGVLGDLLADVGSGDAVAQVGVVAASLILAWALASLLRRRLSPHRDQRYWTRARIARVAFPAIAGLALLVVRRLPLAAHASLVTIAMELALSLALLRAVVYTLSDVFKPSPALYAISKGLAWTVWIAVALDLAGLLDPLATYFEQLGFTVGKQHVSILLLLKAGAIGAATLVASLWAGRATEGHLLKLEGIDLNVRVVLAKLARALYVVLAVLIVLPAFGIDVTVLSVFGGAVGVGLGFGLQKIASNYVSGFIILVDRAIRIGDVITVDGRTGTVTRLNARYTVLSGVDGTEAIIPNETFVTNTVQHYTYTDRRSLLKFDVQIGYDSPLDTALEIMERLAAAEPRVLSDPAPAALVKAFADSGVALELVVWILDPGEGTGQLRSNILRGIKREFERNGISLPFPQREIRILGAGESGPAATKVDRN
jgi:small-conductance mechanosensitive channel